MGCRYCSLDARIDDHGSGDRHVGSKRKCWRRTARNILAQGTPDNSIRGRCSSASGRGTALQISLGPGAGRGTVGGGGSRGTCARGAARAAALRRAVREEQGGERIWRASGKASAPSMHTHANLQRGPHGGHA